MRCGKIMSKFCVGGRERIIGDFKSVLEKFLFYLQKDETFSLI
jgi:hypothetical protein